MKATLTTMLLCAVVTVPLSGQMMTPQRFTIPTAYIVSSVVAAFATKGVELVAEQVTLPAPLVALEEHPALYVTQIELLNSEVTTRVSQTVARVRIECHVEGMCIPFYATVTLPDTGNPSIAQFNKATKTSGQALTPSQHTVHAGDRAMLLLDDDRAQIKLQVVSMEDGSTGQTIRVRTLDHPHFYLAKIVSASLLKGRF